MATNNKKTNKKITPERQWHLVDAEGKILGRLATEVALLLRGKGKVDFAPHIDGGDFVVVVNIDKIKVSGNKEEKKIYYHHTGYPGGIKEISYGKLFEKNPSAVLRKAVWGMLPKNKLRAHMIKRLKSFKGKENPYEGRFK